MNRIIVKYLTLAGLYMMVQVASAQVHFISDTSYMSHVETDLAAKRGVMGHGDLFRVLQRQDLSQYEREALTFLYAYMPESDIADHDGDYFLRQVRLTRQAVAAMPWGNDLDEGLIRHFVLPMRVNNEPLDESRAYLFGELRPLVEHLALPQAILAVNHWCHSRMTYTPSDGRTSSPLQSLRTAYGRCGEESTLCVAALRSVGIPARQVYTPRWAHTDDNHAWVEAWAGDGWHFLGACEPEPVLDLGWFNAPASRSMLMHTKVFGNYAGMEEVMARKPNFTEINVVDNYAATAQITVTVVDSLGHAVPDAKVEFKVYNYAEFYTVATKQTDGAGRTFLTGGLGDMMVWASKDGRWGYAKATFGTQTELTIELRHTLPTLLTEQFDIIPPKENCRLPEVTDEQRSLNDRLLAAEDSMRGAYEQTMLNHDGAVEWCLQHEFDTIITPRWLELSRGNHSEITDFLIRSRHRAADARYLLATLSAKDLRDVPAAILLSHLDHSIRTADISPEAFYRYVQCPRIELEPLTPFKEELTAAVPKPLQAAWHNTDELVRWVGDSISVADDLNTTSVPISPLGVWRSRVADSRSRDIFFVAVMRSLGQPARIDPVTSKVQYMDATAQWHDVSFGSTQSVPVAKGTVRATYNVQGDIQNPKYYTHFTISRLQDGSPELLNFGEGDTYQSLLAKGLRLDAGQYLLITGNRQADGSALTEVTHFMVRPNELTDLVFNMRQPEIQQHTIGTLPPSVAQAVGATGWYVAMVIGVGQEPSNHVLRDIAALRADLEASAVPIHIYFTDTASQQKFSATDFPALPVTVRWHVDTEGLCSTISQSVGADGTSLPLVVLAHTDGRVVYLSTGYTIGIGEQLMKVVNNLP